MSNGAGITSGIIPRQYKSGSIIYFEGDKSEYIYILKSGRVVLTSIKLDTGEEVKEDVRQGEFFGVKSALGKYPREETAQTVGDTVVLVMTLPDFERLILRNANVVRKMLRVFSNQLRRLVKMERSILGESETISPDSELFRIGEYYYNAGVFKQAQYAFKKFMEYYPDSQYASMAMQRIKAIDSGEAIPGGSSMAFTQPSAPAPADDMSDFSLDDDSGGDDDLFDSGDGDDSGPGSSLSNEMDDFLSDDNNGLDDLDDFSLDSAAPAAPEKKGGMESVSEKFYRASGMFSDADYAGALEIYNDITSFPTPEKLSGEDRNLYEKSFVEIGRCRFMTGKTKEALDVYSNFMKKFPSSTSTKYALYQIAGVFEKAGRKDKAIGYYQKVLNMAPKDELNQSAMNSIKKLQSS